VDSSEVRRADGGTGNRLIFDFSEDLRSYYGVVPEPNRKSQMEEHYARF
jgi:hypothetical protein